VTCEFIDPILRDRKPWLDIAQSLIMTVAGIVERRGVDENSAVCNVNTRGGCAGSIPRAIHSMPNLAFSEDSYSSNVP
jgi:hypothetical protein